MLTAVIDRSSSGLRNAPRAFSDQSDVRRAKVSIRNATMKARAAETSRLEQIDRIGREKKMEVDDEKEG